MVVMGAGPSHALYFAAYERTKYSFIQSHPDLSTTAIDTQALPVWISAVSGMVATFFHDAFLNPFDGIYFPLTHSITHFHDVLIDDVVVKQRMQIGYASLETCVSGNAICQPATNTCASSVASSSATLNTATMKYTSLGHCIRHTLKTEGIGAFYVSLPTTLMTNIPFQMIQFTVYEQMRHLLSRLSISTTTTTNNASSPSAPDQPTNTYLPLVHILSGGLAGSTAALLTTPLDLTKTLLQTRSSSTCPKIRHASGFVAVTRVILGQIRDQASVASNGTGYKQRAGLLAAVGVLFRGARARVVGAFPASGLSWLVYEYFKWYFAPTSSSSSSTTYPSAN